MVQVFLMQVLGLARKRERVTEPPHGSCSQGSLHPTNCTKPDHHHTSHPLLA